MNTKTLLAGAAALALAGTANADLLITEVVDATLPGGLPKFVELTNTGSASVDLTQYSFGNMNNGGTTLGGGAASVLTGNLAPGASYVICYEADNGPGASTFFTTYGFEPDSTWLPVDRLLEKPVDPARLISTIKKLIG